MSDTHPPVNAAEGREAQIFFGSVHPSFPENYQEPRVQLSTRGPGDHSVVRYCAPGACGWAK